MAFIGVVAFISGPPTFLYSAAWSAFAGLIFVGSVVIHEMAHAVTRVATGYTVDRVEILGLGGVTSSHGEVELRDDAACTLAGIVTTAVIAAGGALMMLAGSAALRDIGILLVLANLVTLIENVAPVPGNDAGVLLEIRNQLNGRAGAELAQATAAHGRLMLLVVWSVALAGMWVSIDRLFMRVFLTVAAIGYVAWYWREWGSTIADADTSTG